MFTSEEKQMLIELICNEQVKHMIANDKYESKRYNELERLKAKIKGCENK